MKKALLPMALAAALPLTAMADVSVYGRADVSLDLLDDGADYSELNLSSNSSRLGFKAKKEFDGLTALIQIEQQVDYDSGGAFTSARDTFVGLSGPFGLVRAGQFDSPFKRARGPANLFGDQVGDMRNLTRVGDARFDERNPNTIHYQTPKMGSVQLNVAYSVNQGQTAADGASDDALSLSVTFATGPIDFAAAYETYGEDHSRGERDGVRLALGYDVTSNIKLVGFFQSVDHELSDALTSDVFGLGGEFKLGSKTRLRGHYMHRSADIDDGDSAMVAVGIEHRLDSAVRVYANYAAVNNDDSVALNPYTQARTTSVPGVAGETASGLSLGFRYDF
ncbi:porin [Marinimicrobium sp. ABcell2]|uniref:porin n=1 Tax=Marinimicrobium sp. ABcell2 TaxID=3069751 RepID=UPI0027B0F1F3|nr:porin [Marinimicrobium sp. ABcell2]MDQ2078251.1 porin [Marinimicrobium sp. ABcell2]